MLGNKIRAHSNGEAEMKPVLVQTLIQAAKKKRLNRTKLRTTKNSHNSTQDATKRDRSSSIVIALIAITIIVVIATAASN